jgi:GPI mannosyltransferase 3
MAFGQIPFQHVYLNIFRNIVEDIAQHYGTRDAFYYFRSIWDHWGPGLVFPLVAIGLRWKSTWLLAVSAILIVLAFSAIGHKEYRFYYPATLLFTMAGGWALAELSAGIAAMASSRSRSIAVFLAGALVLITVAPENASYASVLSQKEDNRIALEMLAGRQDDVCGLGFDTGLVITGTAGLVHFHRDVAYDTTDITPLEYDGLSRFNYVIVKGEAGTVPFPYEVVECQGNLCLYRRKGACAPSPPTPDGPGPD